MDCAIYVARTSAKSRFSHDAAPIYIMIIF